MGRKEEWDGERGEPMPSVGGLETEFLIGQTRGGSGSIRLGKERETETPSKRTKAWRRTIAMRPLTEEETKAVFEKLHKFVGKNLKALVDRKDEPHCLRLQKNRVFYVRDSLMRRATNVSRDKLVALGVCLGKFTHSGKFRLTVSCLDTIAQYATHKVWVKPSSEMGFLYGNHVTKVGLGRITENTTQNQGVVIFSMADIPLGFGVAAKSTQDCRKLDPGGIVAYHQSDVGEYLRNEEEIG